MHRSCYCDTKCFGWMPQRLLAFQVPVTAAVLYLLLARLRRQAWRVYTCESLRGHVISFLVPWSADCRRYVLPFHHLHMAVLASANLSGAIYVARNVTIAPVCASYLSIVPHGFNLRVYGPGRIWMHSRGRVPILFGVASGSVVDIDDVDVTTMLGSTDEICEQGLSKESDVAEFPSGCLVEWIGLDRYAALSHNGMKSGKKTFFLWTGWRGYLLSATAIGLFQAMRVNLWDPFTCQIIFIESTGTCSSTFSDFEIDNLHGVVPVHSF